MFQPRLPNLRRSTRSEWNQHIAKSSFLYLCGFVHCENRVSDRFWMSRVILALSPLGGSVVILMPRWRMPIGKAGCGDEESHRRKEACGCLAGSPSTILSSSPSQDIIRWQLARSTQCPSRTPSSMRRRACGDWPWPSAIEWKVTSRCCASCVSWLVGSTPGERTKMSGVAAAESASTSVRSSTGGSVKRVPRLLTMKAVAAKTMRSGRRHRTRISRCISEQRVSHSPGSFAACASGCGWRHHSCQSAFAEPKEETMSRKAGSLSSSVTWSHAASDSQSGLGFCGCADLSKTCPPRRKKSHSAASILPAPSRIFAQIWKEKSSLCVSKRARQVERYTK
mmetsp:Transcript_13819/g.40570  ORF Transcript_13819/g.40570 Transcript_13819/m.40570 type:complete len:338 (+) Transcript_13819:1474-2487(+)